MDKKKILICSHTMIIGGVERSLIDLLNNIDYSNFDVDLFLYRHIGEWMDGISTAYYIAEPFCHYRKDNNSLTSVYNENLFVQWNNLFDIMKCYIHENNLDKEYSEALNNRICLSIIGLGLNIVNADKKINKVKEIKNIISSPKYKQAYKKLKLKYFPFHWKVFFALAKYNCAIGVYLMLLAIKILIGR